MRNKTLGMFAVLTVLLAAPALYGGLRKQAVMAENGPAAAFLAHPERCPWLLGDNHTSGETPPPEFHVDLVAAMEAGMKPSGIEANLRRELPFLEIALKPRGLSAGQAIVELSQRCKQRLGRS